MEILPSALCWRIRVPLFIRIRTIRKSGYFASVLELRPVSRCQESSCRSCCNSRSKSICNRGSANPGNRFNASMPSPGWQVLRFVAMMNTFRLWSDLRRDYVRATELELQQAHSPSLKPREAREDDDRRYVAAKLVNIAQSLDRSQFGIPPKRDKLVKGQGRTLWIDRRRISPMSLHARRGVFHFECLLNSFKHILHNSITSHGMKIECFFPFHSSTRVKTLA